MMSIKSPSISCCSLLSLLSCGGAKAGTGACWAAGDAAACRAPRADPALRGGPRRSPIKAGTRSVGSTGAGGGGLAERVVRAGSTTKDPCLTPPRFPPPAPIEAPGACCHPCTEAPLWAVGWEQGSRSRGGAPPVGCAPLVSCPHARAPCGEARPVVTPDSTLPLPTPGGRWRISWTSLDLAGPRCGCVSNAAAGPKTADGTVPRPLALLPQPALPPAALPPAPTAGGAQPPLRWWAIAWSSLGSLTPACKPCSTM